jgi:hypothetical protein
LGIGGVVCSGQKIRFWEDIWVGTAPLAIQFREVYCICNEKTKVISEIWVDPELRLTFRRSFHERMMISWHEVEAVVEDLVLM